MVVLVALLLPVMVLLVGGALDYSRALEARTRLQTATESALSNVVSHIRGGVVHGWRHLQTLFVRRMRAEHERRLQKMGVALESARLRPVRRGLEVTVKAKVRMPFLGLAGYGWMPVTAQAHMPILPSADRVDRARCAYLLRRFRRYHDLERFLRRMRKRGISPDIISRYEEAYERCANAY